MAARQLKDEHWLKQQLIAALHWDDDVAKTVVDLIVNAASPAEIEEHTLNFMDNDPRAVCAIADYLEARKGGGGGSGGSSAKQPQQQQPAPRQQQQQQQRAQGSAQAAASSSSYSGSVSAPSSQQPPPAVKQAAAGPPSSKQQPGDNWLHLGSQPPAAAAPLAGQTAEVGAMARRWCVDCLC